MIFQFHFRGDDETYSYVVASSESCDAVIVDPLEACIDEYADLLGRLGYRLRYTLETGALAKSELAANYLAGKWQSQRVVPLHADVGGAPLRVDHGDRLRLVGLDIEVIGRPGEATGAVSYRIGDRVFVGARQVCDEAALLGLPGDLLVYRSRRLRGTHFGLLGLEAGAASVDRDRWRERVGGRPGHRRGHPAFVRSA